MVVNGKEKIFKQLRELGFDIPQHASKVVISIDKAGMITTEITVQGLPGAEKLVDV